MPPQPRRSRRDAYLGRALSISRGLEDLIVKVFWVGARCSSPTSYTVYIQGPRRAGVKRDEDATTEVQRSTVYGLCLRLKDLHFRLLSMRATGSANRVWCCSSTVATHEKVTLLPALLMSVYFIISEDLKNLFVFSASRGF